MIYSYNYIDHPIQKFHEGINYFFEKMIELNLSVYDENQLLEEWFRPLVNKSPIALKSEMEKITVAYHKLSNPNKLKVKKAFENNQKIGEICTGEHDPKKFDYLQPQSFRKLIKDFYEVLWGRLASQDDGVNTKVIEKCNTIMDHFSKFREDPKHKWRLCPFCGLGQLKPSFSAHRNAYDHYLPKAQYPFIAVNFENLAPMCHECNSDEKSTTDTLFWDGSRKEVYDVFDSTLSDDHFDAQIETIDSGVSVRSTLLKDIDWTYTLLSEGDTNEKLESWDAIFNLKRRYRENTIYYESEWFRHITQEYRKKKEEGRTFDQIRDEILEDLRKGILKTERAIVQYSYSNFILNMRSAEEDLDNQIALNP